MVKKSKQELWFPLLRFNPNHPDVLDFRIFFFIHIDRKVVLPSAIPVRLQAAQAGWFYLRLTHPKASQFCQPFQYMQLWSIPHIWKAGLPNIQSSDYFFLNKSILSMNQPLDLDKGLADATEYQILTSRESRVAGVFAQKL